MANDSTTFVVIIYSDDKQGSNLTVAQIWEFFRPVCLGIFALTLFFFKIDLSGVHNAGKQVYQ